jgi:hypothetical protein
MEQPWYKNQKAVLSIIGLIVVAVLTAIGKCDPNLAIGIIVGIVSGKLSTEGGKKTLMGLALGASSIGASACGFLPQ